MTSSWEVLHETGMDLFDNILNLTHWPKNVPFPCCPEYADFPGCICFFNGTGMEDDGISPNMYYILVVFILRALNIVLHSFGSYLLITLYRQDRTKSLQNLFIIHLSIVELLKNVFVLTSLVMDHHPIFHTEELSRVQFYFSIISSFIITLMYYLAMFFLTIDRLLAVKLNIRYHSICTVRRAKYVLVTSWIIVIGIGICLIVLYEIKNAMIFIPPISTLTYLGLGAIYLLLSIITYTLMFHSLRNSMATQTRDRRASKDGKAVSVWYLFRKSKFIVSVFLIGSFLMMVIIPDIVFILRSVQNNFEFLGESILFNFLAIMLILSDLVDFLIYIFLQDKVRWLFFDKLCCFRKKRTPSRVFTTNTQVYDRRKSSAFELNTISIGN